MKGNSNEYWEMDKCRTKVSSEGVELSNGLRDSLLLAEEVEVGGFNALTYVPTEADSVWSVQGILERGLLHVFVHMKLLELSLTRRC